MNRCASCGANLSASERVCSYCGAQNPAYRPPVDEVNALLEQGLKAFQQEQYALAIDCYRQAIEHDPNIFDAYFYLAESLHLLGREQEALEAMKMAQTIRPGSAAVYYNLGMLCRRMGRDREARKYLQAGLKRVNTDVMLQDRQKMKQMLEEELDRLGKPRSFRGWTR
ncbi:MAG: tetratricopeptide repeat protein [Anaerolineae bacterium]|nr:MAG: tetratricopeptide repeat protein [Anaerolineae bacterium]